MSVDVVPMTVMRRLRVSNYDQARELLNPYIKELSTEELMQLMMLVGKDLNGKKDLPPPVKRMATPKDSPLYTRNLFMASGHILGASFRQLAKLFDISPATVIQAISKILPQAQRREHRLAYRLSLEDLAQYKWSFFNNVKKLENSTPEEIAEWLKKNTELDH